MKTSILLEQTQLAYNGGMDEIALWLFLRACRHMQELGATEPEIHSVLLASLTAECLQCLVEYHEATETDPVEYTGYHSVISIFNPL